MPGFVHGALVAALLLSALGAAHGANATELAGVVECATQHFGARGAPRDDLAVLVVQATTPIV